MRTILLSGLLLLFGNFNAQIKVATTEKEYLELLTLKYDVVTGSVGSSNTRYYKHTFLEGYEYPSIREGYYSRDIFETLYGLIKFYTELANLENQEDGLYKLSISVSGYGNIYAEKLADKVKLYSSEAKIMKYKIFKMENIKADLITLKALAESTP